MVFRAAERLDALAVRGRRRKHVFGDRRRPDEAGHRGGRRRGRAGRAARRTRPRPEGRRGRGDHAIYGPDGVRFYTRMKTVTARWFANEGDHFMMPTR